MALVRIDVSRPLPRDGLDVHLRIDEEPEELLGIFDRTPVEVAVPDDGRNWFVRVGTRDFYLFVTEDYPQP